MADPYYSEYSLSPVLKLKTYFLTEIRTAARISLVCHTPRHVLEVFRWFAEHEEETGLRVMTRRAGRDMHHDRFTRAHHCTIECIVIGLCRATG